MAVDYTFSPNDIYTTPIMTEVVELSFPQGHEAEVEQEGTIEAVKEFDLPSVWSKEYQYELIQGGGDGGEGGSTRPASGFIYPRGI